MNNEKHGLLFLNGTPPPSEIMKTLDFSRICVCADGAYNYVKEYASEQEKLIVLGDGDSILSKPQGMLLFPVEKDDTDGSIGLLKLRELKVTKVEIYGAFGGRPDHEINNYALLAFGKKMGIDCVLRGDYDVYFLSSNKKLVIDDVKKDATVSIVPFGLTSHIIYTNGLYYNADGKTMLRIRNIGISNKATAERVEIKAGQGSSLVFVQRR